MKAAVVMVALVGGCLPQTTFTCKTDATCGPGGVCESVGFCSFADTSCAGGRRYGDVSGSYTKQCVGGTTMTDGGSDATDAPVDAPVSCPVGGNPGDMDCDGVGDSTDNCPTKYNPDQGNEDGDRFGDVCDPCPPYSDPNPIDDADSDGVSDACDPNPSTPGDVIVLFEGFHSSIPSGWDKSGTWSVMSDDAYADSGSGRPYLAPASSTTNSETISTIVTIVSNSGGGARGVGVIDEHQSGTDNAIECGTHTNNTTAELELWTTAPYASLISAAFPFTAGDTYSLVMKRAGTTFTCNGVDGATSQNVTVTNATAPSNPGAGLRHYGATARYKWLMIVSSP